MRGMAIAASCLLLACGARPTPVTPPGPEKTARASLSAVDARAFGLALPRAIGVEAELAPTRDAPNIVLHGTQILLDSEPAGDVTEVIALQRLKRLDVLFFALKARREAWRKQHPGDLLPGVATLWCDRSTSLLVFKSLFQTAAFAAYPSFRLAMLHADTQQPAYQIFRARVPGPPHADGKPPGDSFALHLDAMADGRAQLVWKVGNRVEDVIDASQETLAKDIAEQWQTRGGHRDASDREFDQLVVHVPNELKLLDAVRLLEASHFPQREYATDGKVWRVSAFDVIFSIN